MIRDRVGKCVRSTTPFAVALFLFLSACLRECQAQHDQYQGNRVLDLGGAKESHGDIGSIASRDATSKRRRAVRDDASLPPTVTERDVLRYIYARTGGKSWTVSTNWLSDGGSVDSHCNWFGITCTSIAPDGSALPGKSVEKIELSGNNLKGSLLPSILMRLNNIRVIKLDGNLLHLTPTSAEVSEHEVDLFGRDYHDAAESPITSPLQWLDLSHSDLGNARDLKRVMFRTYSGREIRLPELSDLYLAGTHLQGTLPSDLVTAIPNLERLTLDMNDLEGSIPPQIGNLRNLRLLSLRDNAFDGSIPESLGQLRKLRFLSLRGNQLTGTLPPELSNDESMPFLEHLDLSRQKDNGGGFYAPKSEGLSGLLPSFSSQTNLRQLDLSFNSFSGSIPFDFLASINPQIFDYAFLGSNLITGTVSSSALIRLQPDAVFLEDNLITGLDDSLCASSRGGAVTSFSCDAILCKPGKYGPGKGRQEDAWGPCRDCPNSKYWGATQCVAGSDSGVTRPAPAPTAPDTNGETEILLKFYDATGGPTWNKNYGWNEAADADSVNRRTAVSSFCGWYGITCANSEGLQPRDETVIAIKLESNNLKGSLPKELFKLENLRTLVLAKNSIDVKFHGIHDARNLAELDLRETGLYSTDGISAGRDSLKVLRLDSNPLTDGAIEELLDLTELTELSLDDCEIEGQMSDNIGLLTKLVSFSASNNEITGDIPRGLQNCNDLATLQLRSNSLSGTFPDVLANIKSLSVIDLSNQRGLNGYGGLTGPLPDFSSATALSRLDLSMNSIDGTIPDKFLKTISETNPTSFEYVDLSSNFLSGSVPSVIASLMPNVYLKNNQINGIDSEVCDALEGTALGPFSCDAVLCPPGHYNNLGRQQSFDTACEKCDVSGSARYFGSTACTEVSIGNVGGDDKDQPMLGKLTDVEIIRKIYISCGGARWLDSTNWLKDGATICSYKGITCSENGDVAEISLRSNNLSGIFPSEVFNIKTLTRLILEGNSIEIDFDGIEKADALETIDLTQTGISSVNGISRARGLKELFLTSNNIRGTFPSEIFELRRLSKLSLAFNSLSSTLPENFGVPFGEMRFLDMNENMLEGSLPSILPVNLEMLLLSGNSFSGSIPAGIDSLAALRFVDLSKQRSSDGLTGPLPSFSSQRSIKRVDLSRNAITGSIPFDFLDSVSPGEHFDYIDLSSNELTGEIPGALAKFDVDALYLANNKFTGIDDELCDPKLGDSQADFGCLALLCPPKTYNEQGRQRSRGEPCDSCPSAQYYGSIFCDDRARPTRAPTLPDLPPVAGLSEETILRRFYEVCGGPRWTRSDGWNTSSDICDWFGVRCSPGGRGGVVSIMLSSNNLIGSPPEELFQLPNLESLVLDSNKILFAFKGISHAQNLMALDVSSTGMYSVNGIGDAPSLKMLNLASNALEGVIPNELFELESLEQLTLDFNSFSGPLPLEVIKSEHLELLSIASNQLTGSLPASVVGLTSLFTLRLQNNILTGSLPQGLDLLTNLNFLDLSHQKKRGTPGLEGPLPDLSKFGRLRRIDLSSNSLSGSIPFNFLEGVSSIFEYADLSSNELTGEIPSDISSLENLYLQDNKISDIDRYCTLVTSNEVQKYGCDAVLCPPRSYADKGRQTSDYELCVPCEWSLFYGATECSELSATSNTIKDEGGNGNSGDIAPANTPIAAPTSVEAERYILEKLFQGTDGYRWNDNSDWLSTDVKFCDWKGIICLEGSGETVKAISLGANNLNGVPPREIFDLPNLESISLYSNPLGGFDFFGIEKAVRLKELYLDQTGLKSVDGIGMAPSLTTLNLRFNSIQGGFPPDLLEIRSLKSLTLSHNFLDGPLPNTVAMSNLESLILSSNNFQGKLDGVAFSPALHLLDLSKNELSGSIPKTFLSTLPDTTISYVDLSENLLTGVVPSPLTRFDEMTLLVANNFIIGIEETICYKVMWNDGDVGKFECDGFLCPIGTFAPNGRQTSRKKVCQQCPDAPFWGMTECVGKQYRYSAASRKTVSIGIATMTLSAVATIFLAAQHLTSFQ